MDPLPVLVAAIGATMVDPEANGNGDADGRQAMTSAAGEIRVGQHGRHVATLTIDNQARRNAMSRAMLADLAAFWDRLESDPDCRAVVVTGAGDKAFTSGADVSGDLSASAELARTVNRGLLKTSIFSKPIIAAVNGDCAAGGLELLLACDIRASAPHARFGLPEVKWSIYPFGGATVKLIQQVGHVHAMDLLLTGRLVDAAEAARIGLVNRVMAADALMAWALQTAETIAHNSPTAVQAVKTQISATIAAHAQSREALDQELGDRVRAHPHFKEGVAAFLAKRKPDYR
jgi:enoyl-CoA hydratase/carnithine racemase